MSDPPLASTSSAFDRLDPRLQKWVFEQGWEGLRPFQDDAVGHLLETSEDLIVSASTASGKTEAVFLPLLTQLAPGRGLRLLYVSPLKALINDQADRLEVLASRVDVAVHRWHGDINSHRKAKLLSNPDGLLLITPESLEALLVLRGPEMATVLAGLDTVVIDELHVFLGTERGRQLQSQLHRIETLLGRHIRRVALSATLGDPLGAIRFLRRDGTARVLVSGDQGRVVQLQVRADATPPGGDSRASFAAHLYRTLLDSDSLVFCNSRRDVEEYTDSLRSLETENHVPATFFPHHGSLARELREEVETRLRSGQRTGVVCTTTLELGIDFGQMQSIAQIDAPPSVAALFQRLGRSGRRGAPSAARIYVSDETAWPDLRPNLVQAVAMVSLLLERWIEPHDDRAWHLSTLVQQILSLVAERHGIKAGPAYDILCRLGPFSAIESGVFGLVLRSLGQKGLLTQMADGTLVLDTRGAREVGHYSFYAAFSAADEYTVRCGEQTLGKLAVGVPLQVGTPLLFAGRSWKVLDANWTHRTISVEPAAFGTVPSFVGTGIPVHDTVRQRMRRIYEESAEPRFLDTAAVAGLRAARAEYASLDGPIATGEGGVLLFPWRGDKVLNTLRLQLSANFPAVVRDRAWLRIPGAEAEEVRGVVSRLVNQGPASAADLASGVRTPWSEKWDRELPDVLLWAEYGHKRLDPQGAWEALQTLVQRP